MKIVLQNLTKQFESRHKKGETVTAVNNLDIEIPDGKITWGCGIKNDIIDASVCALLSAVNKVLDAENIK